MNNSSYQHLSVCILIISTASAGSIGCGSTGSGSESPTGSPGGGAGTAGNAGSSATAGSAGAAGTGTAGAGAGGMAGSSGATGGSGASTASATGGSGGSSGSGGAGAGGSGGSGGSGASGGSSSSSGGLPTAPPYLVSVDHWASPSRLLKIDIATGAGKEVCTLPADVDDVNYHSLTFDEQGVLYLENSATGTLDIIDPCKINQGICEVIHPCAGGGVPGISVPGISSNQNGHIYGIETTQSHLVDFDFMSCAWVPVPGANLSAVFTSTGAGWSDKLYGGMGGLWAIRAQDNSLDTIALDGQVTNVGTIPVVSFAQSVGVEMHPANGVIYACQTDKVLYEIDPTDMDGNGILDVPPKAIGNGMGHTKTCNNLAAPWVPIACLDAL